MPRYALLAGALMLAACATHTPSGEPETTFAGRDIVGRYCSGCHAVSRSDVSTHRDAPPLRHIGRSYPVRSLEETLAEGMMVGHPDMPQFRFEPAEIEAVISYLESIQD